jgi:hypothetical protein
MRLGIWKNSMRSRRMEMLQARSIRIPPIAPRCRKSTGGKVAFGASSRCESDPKRSVTARFGTFIRFTCQKPDALKAKKYIGIARGEAVALGKLFGEWHCGRAAIVARPQAVKNC